MEGSIVTGASIYEGTEQVQRMRDRLVQVQKGSRFYRTLFAESAFEPLSFENWDDLVRVPFVTKASIIADQQNNMPFGSQLCTDATRVQRIYCSGGSQYLFFDEVDLDQAAAIMSFQLAEMGVCSDDVVDICSSFHWVVGGTLLDAAVRRMGAAVVPGGPGQTEYRIRVLKEARVTVVQAFTPYAESLGEALQQGGIDPSTDLAVRLLVIGGEMRSRESLERIGKVWGGVSVREQYGTGELGMVAAECDAGDGMHISEYFLLETVDPDTGAPVRDPSAGGEVVITEMWKRAQPFIRYRTGDITEGVRVGTCACGRSTPRLGRIVGRRSEVLRVKGLFIQPTLVREMLQLLGYQGRHRLVVDRPATEDRLTVVLEQDFVSDIDEDVLLSRLKGSVGIRCHVEVVDVWPDDAALVEDKRWFE